VKQGPMAHSHWKSDFSRWGKQSQRFLTFKIVLTIFKRVSFLAWHWNWSTVGRQSGKNVIRMKIPSLSTWAIPGLSSKLAWRTQIRNLGILDRKSRPELSNSSFYNTRLIQTISLCWHSECFIVSKRETIQSCITIHEKLQSNLCDGNKWLHRLSR
jgi:hypothetical protein